MNDIRLRLPALLVGILSLVLFTACSSDDSGDDDDATDDDYADDDDNPSDDDSIDDDSADDDTQTDDDTTPDDDDDTTPDDDADDDTVPDDDSSPDDDTIDDDTSPDDDTSVDDDTAADDDTNPDDDTVQLPEFLFGISQGSSGPALQYMPELGMHWFRRGITLKSLTPEVLDPELTMADLQANPDLVYQFIDEVDWTNTDNDMRALLAAGIQPMPSVGHGWIGTLPLLNGQTATPDVLGRDHYLAQQYRYVRAVVERYDGDGDHDADGIVVKIWQIENELNVAAITTLYGWREPTGLAGLFSAWADWNFLTELLATLNQAAHDADPEAITIQNLHTDIHPNFTALLGLPSWIDAATLWRDLMDVIGFDAYPNYYESTPVRGTVVGERVTTLQQAAPGKLIVAVEVGYPTGPSELGYDEDKQAQFIDEAFHSAYEAGIAGYFHFGLVSSDTHTVDITQQDIDAMAFLGPHFADGDVWGITGWALAHLSYLMDPHFVDVLQAVEGYWGVVNTQGYHKPGFAVLQAIAAEISQQTR